jgi:glyceraldehyde 3-phosphate dehydrogenase
MAMRVPTVNGSITEFVVNLEAEPDAEEINDAFRAAAAGDLEGVLGVTDDRIVSRDVLGNPHSSYVDLQSTNVVADGKQAKVLTWYDNEYGFSNRMLDVATYVADE